jgi:hypothetical protein
MREIRRLIEQMCAPKCQAQQGIEIFPKFNFGVVLFGRTPFCYRTTKDAKIAECGKSMKGGSRRTIGNTFFFVHNSSFGTEEDHCRRQACLLFTYPTGVWPI